MGVSRQISADLIVNLIHLYLTKNSKKQIKEDDEEAF